MQPTTPAASAALPDYLRMECTYLLRGHAARGRALREGRLTEAEQKKYRAVERAIEQIEPVLRRPVMDSIVRRTAYEYYPVPCGRQTFYRRRKALLVAVARELGYL